jgi:DNA topoisomerase-3
MLKGKTAYGCSEYKNGCKFIIPFDVLKNDYNTDVLTDAILGKMK